MIRILVADDHAIVRQGLSKVLALAPDMEMAGEAKNGWEVIEQVRNGGYDLLLLDMTLPGPCGIDLIKRLRSEAPHLPILVLSMHNESQIAGRAIKVGAAGYLTKDSEPNVLIAAIRQVAAGGHAIDPSLAARMVFESVGNEADEAPHQLLSNREFQIFLKLAAGHGINDIGAAFNISPKTVSTHKARLMQKLGLESTSELVRYALRHGLVE
jgi:DNA-binding NarL/FixJ family response regulator